MTTRNDYMNDYMLYIQDHKKKEEKHEEKTVLKQKYGENLSNNRHLALVTDMLTPYKQPLKQYQQPIIEVFNGNFRNRILEELKIRPKKSSSENLRISYGPRKYTVAA